jgi:hypothetical protein
LLKELYKKIISKKNLLEIPPELEGIIDYLNRSLIQARKAGQDSFVWEIYKSPPLDEEDVIETKFSGPFHQTVIDAIIKLLTDGEYLIETFQSEVADFLRIKITWANEELEKSGETKLNGSRRLRLNTKE